MITLTILVAAVFMVLIEVPILRRQKLKKEMWIFAFLIISNISLCIMQATGVQIPSPLAAMEYVYEPLSKMIYTWLS